MKVSVIMAVYNGEFLVESAIESILNQTHQDLEFIIVDDGSKDNTLNIIRKYESKDKRIKVIKNNTNLGLTKSLNRAIEKSTGEYIVRQDADDLSLSKRLEILLKFLEVYPEFAFCGSDGTLTQNINKELVKRFKYDEIKSSLIAENCFLHPSIIIKKEILERYGYYDESYLYGQDYELWCRLIFKYKLKAANLREKLILINLPSKKNNAKFITQRINSIRTKLKYLKYMQYKAKCIFAILIRIVEILIFNQIMKFLSKILQYIKC